MLIPYWYGIIIKNQKYCRVWKRLWFDAILEINHMYAGSFVSFVFIIYACLDRYQVIWASYTLIMNAYLLTYPMSSHWWQMALLVPWGTSGPCDLYGWGPVIRAPSLIARFMGPTGGPDGANRTQVGPMLNPWTLLSGIYGYSGNESKNSINCKLRTKSFVKGPLIARFIGPTWGPSGTDRTQMGPMLAPWTLLSGTMKDLDIWVTWIHIGLWYHHNRQKHNKTGCLFCGMYCAWEHFK